MLQEINFIDIGTTEYFEAWKFQQELFNRNLLIKNKYQISESENSSTVNYLIFCEHPHVFTLGKNGSDKNLLVDEEYLKSKGVSFFRTNRGGDITYHGPGQIVGYPVFDLGKYNIGVKEYIYKIEECIILLLQTFNIKGQRLKGATGVWLDINHPSKPRKICAIGVRVSRFITMHGFAFNVNTDLSYYNFINPCGYTDKDVTSLEKETGKKQDMEELKKGLKKYFLKVFGTA